MLGSNGSARVPSRIVITCKRSSANNAAARCNRRNWIGENWPPACTKSRPLTGLFTVSNGGKGNGSIVRQSLIRGDLVFSVVYMLCTHARVYDTCTTASLRRVLHDRCSVCCCVVAITADRPNAYVSRLRYSKRERERERERERSARGTRLQRFMRILSGAMTARETASDSDSRSAWFTSIAPQAV